MSMQNAMKSVRSAPVMLILALALSATPLRAGTHGGDDELTAARNVFLKAVDGDSRAVRQANRLFRSLNSRYPDNPVYLAYLGASLTLKGRDAQNNLNKRQLTEDGLARIDRALDYLAEHPDEPAVRTLDTRLVAASSFIYIPSFFNRYDRGRVLLQQILEDPGFAAMAPAFRAAAYFTSALVASGNHDDEAYRRYLTQAADTDPEGRDGRAAKALLAEQSAPRSD